MVRTGEEQGATVTGLLSLGNLSLNLNTFEVTVGSEVVTTSYQEFELLRELMQNENRIIPHDALTRVLWNETGKPAVRRLNVLMHRLRTKLAVSAPYRLRTVRSRGYGLIAAGGAQG
jgi:DNA-binding response OmpR family regulator